MKHSPNRIIASVLSLAVAVLSLAACGSDKPKADRAPDPATARLIADYPLDSCVVTQVKLGDHGKPHDVLYEGKLVRFCCSSCIKEFNTNAPEFVAKIDAARSTQ